MSNSNTTTDVEPCFFIAILECTIWSFVCVGLGVLLGGAFGVLITLFVFLFTAVWAPFRICKLMCVTITTDECFRGPLGPILRVAVFFYVPIFPILHLIWVTLLCATIGTLFCIGKTTEMFFKHEYGTTMKMFQTELEDYVHRCRDLLVHDDELHTSI